MSDLSRTLYKTLRNHYKLRYEYPSNDLITDQWAGFLGLHCLETEPAIDLHVNCQRK